jgi:hypothetical protein
MQHAPHPERQLISGAAIGAAYAGA